MKLERYVIKRYGTDGRLIGYQGAPFLSKLLAETSCKEWNKALGGRYCKVERESWDNPKQFGNMMESYVLGKMERRRNENDIHKR